MTTITVYDDEYCSVIDHPTNGRQLVIKKYYFPVGTKTVSCKDMETIEDYTDKFTPVVDKSWGMGVSGIWWARQMMRFSKTDGVGFIVVTVRGDSPRKGFSCKDVKHVIELCMNPELEGRAR